MKAFPKLIGLLILLMLFPTMLSAQQIFTANNYLGNRYMLSPSYGGIDEYTTVYVGYKREWANIETGPRTSYANAFFPSSENVWFGAQVISDQSDIFRNTQIHFSYIQHMQVGSEGFLDFSIWGTMLQNYINLAGVDIADVNDPLLMNSTEFNGTALNAGTSLMYRWREGAIGVNIPFLFQNKDAYSVGSNKNLFVINRHFVAYASYNFRVNYDLDFEPMLVYRSTTDVVSQIEATALFKYRDNYWAGITYKDIGKTMISLGAVFAYNFIINYSYEFATGADISQPAATHEFTVGFIFGKYTKKSRRRSYYGQAY